MEGSKAIGKKCRGVPAHKLESRLAAYMAAAGAAGAGVLALAQPGEAQVIYTPAHVVIGPGETFNLDLNHDGVTDFSFVDFLSPAGSFGSLHVTPFASNEGQGGNAVEVNPGAILYPLPLSRHARIGKSQIFYGSCVGCTSALELMVWIDPYAEFGKWLDVQNRYLGLKFLVNHEVHFGWARFSVGVEDQSRVTALLTGYAYQAMANKPILAGQVSGPAGGEAASPDSSAGELSASHIERGPISQEMLRPSLDVLAVGAAGLALWRKN